MPRVVTLYLLSGPLIMVAAHFQAIGDAPRAAVLGLSKPYIFALPLTFVLPLLFGAQAIWWVSPAAEAMLAGLAGLVLFQIARRGSLRRGVFGRPQEGFE